MLVCIIANSAPDVSARVAVKESREKFQVATEHYVCNVYCRFSATLWLVGFPNSINKEVSQINLNFRYYPFST